MKENRKYSAVDIALALCRAGCYLLLFLVCQTLVAFVIVAALALFGIIHGNAFDVGALITQTLDYASHITLASSVLTLLFLLVFFLIRRKKPLSEVGLVKASPAMAVAAALLSPGFYAVVITVLGFLPEAWLESYAEASAALSDTGVMTFLATVIAAPLAEEVIFRGLILSRLRRALPGWLAVILSALAFGLCHGQLVWASYAFVLGLFFGWIALRTGSIVPTVAAHLVFNLIGFISSCFEDSLSGSGFLLFIAVLLVISVIGCLLNRRGLSQLFRPSPSV